MSQFSNSHPHSLLADDDARHQFEASALHAFHASGNDLASCGYSLYDMAVVLLRIFEKPAAVDQAPPETIRSPDPRRSGCQVRRTAQKVVIVHLLQFGQFPGDCRERCPRNLRRPRRAVRGERSEVQAAGVKGNRCLAMAYVSARTIMDRLDDVLGVGEWQTATTSSPTDR